MLIITNQFGEKNRVLTLDISSTEISIIEVDRGRVIRWAKQTLEPGIFEEEVVVNHQLLGEAIRQLISSIGVRTKDIVVSVSGLYSLSRIVLVPVPPGEEVSHQAVVDAAIEVMPISEEEMYISWQHIGSVEGGQQVLVVSVPRDMIDGEMRAIKLAGINPRVLDLKAMAVTRAVNRDQALILNIEQTSYDIIMIVDGLVEIMRTTAWVPDALSPEERMDQLALGLELTVGFYDSNHVDHPFNSATPLIVTGHFSGDDKLIKMLEERTGYRTEPPVPPLEYPEGLPLSQYAVNIGLALKGSSPGTDTEQRLFSPPDINFLPAEYKPRKASARQVYTACAIIAVLVLLVPLYQITSSAMEKVATLEKEFSTLNSLLEVRKAELAKREPLKKAIDSFNTVFNGASDITADLEAIISIADELDIEISSLVHGISNIKISCQAGSAIAFDDFITALEESGRFSTPVIPPEGYPYITGGSISVTPVPPEEPE